MMSSNLSHLTITNEQLRKSHVPPLDADWYTIEMFALTFDAYAFWGDFEQCAKIAYERRVESLAEVRTCLFFEQRRWRHFGEEPEGKDLAYILDLLKEIRERCPQ